MLFLLQLSDPTISGKLDSDAAGQSEVELRQGMEQVRQVLCITVAGATKYQWLVGPCGVMWGRELTCCWFVLWLM
jgi:hypothetical protein